MRGCRSGTPASVGSVAIRQLRQCCRPLRRRRLPHPIGTRCHWPQPCMRCLAGDSAGSLHSSVCSCLLGARHYLSVSAGVVGRARSRYRPLKSRDPATDRCCRRTCASTRRWVVRRASLNRRFARSLPISTHAGCTRAELAVALDCLERECYAIAPPAPAEVAMAVDVFDRLHASLNGVMVP